MKHLGSNARTWLKSIHIVFAAIWTGAGLCIIFLLFSGSPSNGDELHGINSSMKLIDDFIVIPCAIGSLITGLLISMLTRWGFFKYHWVTSQVGGYCRGSPFRHLLAGAVAERVRGYFGE